jgi:hypothetical protein
VVAGEVAAILQLVSAFSGESPEMLRQSVFFSFFPVTVFLRNLLVNHVFVVCCW